VNGKFRVRLKSTWNQKGYISKQLDSLPECLQMIREYTKHAAFDTFVRGKNKIYKYNEFINLIK